MQARTLVTYAVISYRSNNRNTIITTLLQMQYTGVTIFLHKCSLLIWILLHQMKKQSVHQGIIASSPSPQIIPGPNEHLQTVVVLPYRSDGSIYKGILSFTATKPVEVTFNHRIPLDNATLSQLDMEKFGKMFIRHLTAFPGNISAIGRIIPDYSGSTSPYFSASMPFVSSSVVLRTNDEPFISAYEVYADIVQPKVIEHLENATVTNITNASS